MDLVMEDAAFMPYHAGQTARRRKATTLHPFVAWDGEGITAPGEDQQNYVLFGNSLGYRVVSRKLGTDECLALIIATEQDKPDSIHVGFSFSYDVEMILRDLSMRHMSILRAKGFVLWRGYRIEYKKSKWFQVTKRVGDSKVTARIWDVWGFFQCSFVAALRDNLTDIPPDELARIEAGKAGRSQFAYAELDDGSMIAYWEAELRYTVAMMTALRDRLYAAQLPIKQWHGPGAIASYAYKANGMAAAMDREPPPDVNRAAQYAYAGGRFELFRIGHHPATVYAYDIRSAYPSGIVQLPNLATGKWSHNPNPDPHKLARFGVYRIRFASEALMTSKPMPFFYRDSRYAIHFPNVVTGWYWSPEAEFASMLGDDAVILEGWEYDEDGSRPFAWVNETYETRAQWKRDGNASQMALKLLLNSMYGKMAQRVGWEHKKAAPQWHQLEWAGYVTSFARAKLFRAMLLAARRDALIGVETDGIFSAAPLPLDIGPGLGQWEAETYDAMVYLQSGFYFKRNGTDWTAKYRGFDKGSVTVDDAMSVLRAWKPWLGDKGILTGTTTRFATMGMYVNSPFGDQLRNRWQTVPRSLNIGGDGKRIHRHAVCPECRDRISPADAMHRTTISYPIGGESLPHILPWLLAPGESDPNPYREDDYSDNR